MRIYDRLIISLAFLFGLTTVILSTSNHGLDVYFSVYLVECLALTMLFSRLSPRARTGLNRIGYVLLFCFIILVLAKVAEIVSGTNVL